MRKIPDRTQPIREVYEAIEHLVSEAFQCCARCQISELSADSSPDSEAGEILDKIDALAGKLPRSCYLLDQTDPAATLAIDIYESVSVRVEHKGWRRLFAVIGAIRPLLNRLDRRLESMEDLDMARRHESAMVACRERSRRNIELTESLRLKGKLPDYVEVVVRKIESNASDFIDVEKERKHVRARIRNAIEARATELPRLIKPLTENDRSILVVMLQLDASLAKPETARVIADAALVGDPKRAFKNVMKNKLAISTRGTTGGYLLTDAGKSWGTFLSDCTNAGLDYHNIGFTP